MGEITETEENSKGDGGIRGEDREDYKSDRDRGITEGHKEFTAEESARAKTIAQGEANAALDKNRGDGLVVMATGSGKSKIGIDRANEVRKYTTFGAKILLVVPTEVLRDITWKAEFERWSVMNLWQFITPICYKSLHTLTNTTWDLIILDECHHITDTNSQFFWDTSGNVWENIIGLTATEPRHLYKSNILKSIGLHLVYELTLDEAVERGIVAPYEITMVGVNLDDTDKYIRAGSKEKGYFYNTEKRAYEYRERLFLSAPGRLNIVARMKLLYGIKSKTEAAIKILEYLIPEEMRTMIFCATKEQANEVCRFRYYSKPTKPKIKSKIAAYEQLMNEYQGKVSYELFVQLLINRISCCQALNEGINIPDLDCGLILQINSSDLEMVQRLGRHIRYRPGHKGKIIGLYVRNTVDEVWARDAVKKLDKNNIRWIEYDKLRKGEQTINF